MIMPEAASLSADANELSESVVGETIAGGSYDNGPEPVVPAPGAAPHHSDARKTTIEHFEDYGHENVEKQPLYHKRPWEPFRTRLDFEFAEIALSAALNKDHTEALIKLVHRCVNDRDSFTLKGHTDLSQIWEGASHKLTPFQKTTVTVPYQGTDQSFDVHARPLWDWALDLLSDPLLSSSFTWDAQRLFKYDKDETFVRFFHEPWTGNRFWDIQVGCIMYPLFSCTW